MSGKEAKLEPNRMCGGGFSGFFCPLDGLKLVAESALNKNLHVDGQCFFTQKGLKNLSFK